MNSVRASILQKSVGVLVWMQFHIWIFSSNVTLPTHSIWLSTEHWYNFFNTRFVFKIYYKFTINTFSHKLKQYHWYFLVGDTCLTLLAAGEMEEKKKNQTPRRGINAKPKPKIQYHFKTLKSCSIC